MNSFHLIDGEFDTNSRWKITPSFAHLKNYGANPDYIPIPLFEFKCVGYLCRNLTCKNNRKELAEMIIPTKET